MLWFTVSPNPYPLAHLAGKGPVTVRSPSDAPSLRSGEGVGG
jgi:hypothetical protein